MKKLLFSFFLLLIFANANAQEKESIFYYYKGEKHFYPVSYDRLVVGVEHTSDAIERRANIAELAGLPLDSVVSNFQFELLLKCKGKKVSEVKSIMNKLRLTTYIHYARPVFLSESGQYNSYGENFIVKLKKGTQASAMYNLMEKTGVTLVKKYPFQDDIFILAAGKATKYDALTTSNSYYETGLFAYAEPDKIVYDALHAAPPNDPLFYLQWSHTNTGSAAQYNGTSGVDMKIQAAWDYTMGNPAIKIGVIDEGVDLTHPDLQGNVLQGFNGQTMTSNPGDGAPLGPGRAHGTNCAGIIAAKANNGIGIAGIAPECKIIPAVIFGNSSTNQSTYLGDAAVAASFDYCRNAGADVISNSWGGGSVSSTIDDAINRAVTLGRGGKGCVILFSSGNGNTSTVGYPGNNTQVISIGGISMCNQRKATNTCDGETWWGANYGQGLDLVAPCVKIASTDNQGTAGYNTAAGTAGDYYNTFNGTSSSCPNAAGVAALVLSLNSNLTRVQVKRILELSANKIPAYSYASNPDPNQPNGSWNIETGHGSINALSAVQLTQTGNFCGVQISSGGTELCNPNSPIQFQVVTPDATSTYHWYRNGDFVSSGTTLQANKSGWYRAQVINGACSSFSNSIDVIDKLTLSPIATPFAVCAGGSTVLKAQSNSTFNIKVGTGTNANSSTGYPCPLQDYYESSRAQYLYRASEMRAAGMNAGNINAIKFNITNLNGFTGTIEEMAVRIGTSSVSSLTATTWENAPTAVYGPVNYVPVLGLNTLTFSSPFYWNGVENIIIEICNGAANNATPGVKTYTENPSVSMTKGLSFNGSHTYRADDQGNTCATVLTTNTDSLTSRPNITFVSSGLPNYSYSWSQSPVTSTLTSTTEEQVTATNIQASTVYSVTASDSICSVTKSVAVFVSIPQLTTTSIVLPPSGTVDLNTGITSSTTDLIIKFYSDSALTNQLSSPSVSNAGTYYVTATTNQGCTKVASIVVTSGSCTAISSIKAGANPICAGTTTTLTAEGVTGPNPVVKWYTGSNGTGTLLGTGTTLTNRGAGTYYARVSSDCNNIAQASIVITRTVITSTFTTKQIICYGQSGSVTVTARGGKAPYMYKLGTGGTYQTSGTFAGLRATSYRVYILDSSGCIGSTDLITITSPPVVNKTISITKPTCFGATNGAITMNITGGTPPYQYKLGSNGVYQPTGTFTGLKATSYRIYYVDSVGCSGYTDLINVTQPAQITSSFTTTDVTCNGGTNGTITVALTGGTAPYQYRLGTSGAYQSIRVFKNLRATTYRVYYKDTMGCTGSTTAIVVNQPPVVTGTAATTTPSCFGGTNGSITITPTTGKAPHRYRLSTISTYQTSNTIAGLKAGTYQVFIQDSTGCISSISNIVVQQPSAISATFNITNESCPGASNGAIVVNATGGAGGYQFKLGSRAYQTSNVFNNLRASSYRIYILDTAGCTYTSPLLTVANTSPTCSPTIVKQPFEKAEQVSLGFDALLYPNPSNSQFSLQVKSAKNETVQVRVIDVTGKVVHQVLSASTQPIRFGGGLSTGMYIVEVRQGKEVKTLKAVKVK
jgi:subtilisin family serine protease